MCLHHAAACMKDARCERGADYCHGAAAVFNSVRHSLPEQGHGAFT